jgi:hypothetical protein
VSHPGGSDVVVRDRKFLREHWSYTVVIEGRQQDILESGLRLGSVRPLRVRSCRASS